MSQQPSRRVAPAAASDSASQQQSPPTPPTSDTEQKRHPQSEPEPELVIYEPFLYDLSPTWDAWCFLRVAEIHALELYHDMGDHSAYFSGNLPIRWARIVGVVVGVDDYYEGKRRVFTIDDSSGACIECASLPDAPAPSQPNSSVPRPSMSSSAPSAAVTTTAGPTLMYPDVTLGSVVEIKGRIVTFRRSRQLRIVSMKPVRCTAHEVVLWGKRVKFARETLGTRWAVDERHIRRRKSKIDEHRAEVRARMTLKGSLGRSRGGGGGVTQKQGHARGGGNTHDDGGDDGGGKRAGGGSGGTGKRGEMQSQAKQPRQQQQQQQQQQKQQQHTGSGPMKQCAIMFANKAKEKRERTLALQKREQELAARLVSDDHDQDEDDNDDDNGGDNGDEGGTKG